jgi:hypothetical protein
MEVFCDENSSDRLCPVLMSGGRLQKAKVSEKRCARFLESGVG